jgi:transcriptional regulator with XRE-family HTH domain
VEFGLATVTCRKITKRAGLSGHPERSSHGKVSASRRRLMEIEAGVCDPSLGELLRLAEALGSSVDQLTRNRNAWATSGK